MQVEIITQSERLLIRRLVLEPNEAMPWHTDACRRFSVVVRGERLRIEYRDRAEPIEFDVHPGMVGWDDPEPYVHRAVNTGMSRYEEVVTFYRERSDIDPQPETP